MSDGRFRDRGVFVTGAGSGIGRATAGLFAVEGARVFAVDVNDEGLQGTERAIREAAGTVETMRCDVADPEAVQAAIARAVAAFGRLDVLCNIAGMGSFKRFEELSAAEWNRVLAVNLTGMFHTIQAALPHLLEPPVGNVVNVGSTASLRGSAYAAHYAASKAGVHLLTRSLALEFATRGMRFNCVCPGGVNTPLVRGFKRRADFEMHLINYQMAPNPTQFADPIDIAHIITFLASDDARQINGASLLADGGALA